MNYYLIGAMVGAGAGYALSKTDREKWAMIGAGAGVAAGYIATKLEEPAVAYDGTIVAEDTGEPITEVAQGGVAPQGWEGIQQPYAGYSAQGYSAPAVTAAGGGAGQVTPSDKITAPSRSIPGLGVRTGGATGGGTRTVGSGSTFTGTGTSGGVRRTRIRRTMSDPMVWTKTR